jgi:hypothetical protein
MAVKIKNNLNIWEEKGYYRWYRIDQRVAFFFRKIKWMFQRAKYGYCDKDLWSLDYTLGNYIASSVNELANRTHGYPFNTTENEWDDILRTIAKNFYLATNEEEWVNPYEDMLEYGTWYKNLPDDKKEYWDKWFKVEFEHDLLRENRRQEGFQLLSKWFTHLWD